MKAVKCFIALCLSVALLVGCGAKNYFDISRNDFIAKLQENEIYEIEYTGNDEDEVNINKYFYSCNDTLGTLNLMITENKDKQITQIFISCDEDSQYTFSDNSKSNALFAVVAEKAMLIFSPDTDPNEFSEKYKTLEKQEESISCEENGFTVTSGENESFKSILFTKEKQ